MIFHKAPQPGSWFCPLGSQLFYKREKRWGGETDYEPKVSVQRHLKVTKDERGMEAERENLLYVQICAGNSGETKMEEAEGRAR